MSVDQDELRNTAKTLGLLYEELDEAKYEKPPAPTESRMGSNKQKGPIDPLPIWTLSDDEYFTTYLNYWCNKAHKAGVPLTDEVREKGFGRDGQRMCGWIAWEAGAISELPFASSILYELRNEVKELDYRLKRNRPFQPAGKEEGEAWLTARSICYTLRQQGYSVTPELLRKWAERGNVQRRRSDSGSWTYLLSECVVRIRHGQTGGESPITSI